MAIDLSLDGFDLTSLHTLLCIYGALICVYVMQLTSHEDEDRNDPWIVRQGTRVGLVLLALTFLWSLYFSNSKGWQPWAPDLATDAVMAALMTLRAYTVRLSQRRRKEAQAISSFASGLQQR